MGKLLNRELAATRARGKLFPLSNSADFYKGLSFVPCSQCFTRISEAFNPWPIYLESMLLGNP